MSLDGNKLQKVFQDSVSKACCLIMMMSVKLMRVLIDTKQMAAVARLHHRIVMYCTASTGTIAVPRETAIKQEFV